MPGTSLLWGCVMFSKTPVASRAGRTGLWSVLGWLVGAGVAMLVLWLAPPPSTASPANDPALVLPDTLSGTVEFHWEYDNSGELGGNLSETIATSVVLRRTKDTAQEAVYELQSGLHHFTGVHTEDVAGCESSADMEFPAVAGSATLTVDKTLITRRKIAYRWAAQNTPQALVRTVWCAGYGISPREQVGQPEPWWPNTLPGLAGSNFYQPWEEAFTGFLSGQDDAGTLTLTWSLTGAPIAFDPGDQLTQAEKKLIKRYAAAKRVSARAWKRLEITCGIVGLAGGGAPAGACAIFAATLEHFKDTQAEELDKIAEDPPRADYRIVSKPKVPDFVHVRATAVKYRSAARAVNKYLANAARQAALARVILRAMERAQGADAAGSSMHWQRQVLALHRYSAQMADLMDREDQLGRSAQKGLRRAGLRGRGAEAALATLTHERWSRSSAIVFRRLGDHEFPPPLG
jgi:hypothetical protein